jgi:hypothetical protein
MRNVLFALAILCLAGGPVRAEESPNETVAASLPAATQQTDEPAIPHGFYIDVRSVDLEKYFQAKGNKLPIREIDTLDLLKQEGHALQLSLERWSVDNSPPQDELGRGVAYYPTHDKLDFELNRPQEKFSLNYTGKKHRHRGEGFYPNPVTSDTERVWDGVQVPFGWSDAAPGNFSYVYMLDDQGRVVNYHLYFYGPYPEAGFDIDGDQISEGVIMHLAGGTTQSPPPVGQWYCLGQPVTLH